MVKKIIFILLLVLLICTTLGFIFRGKIQSYLQGKKLQGTKLSERSQEFIKGQKESDDTWRFVQEDEENLKKGKPEITELNVDDCFSLAIPYNIINERTDRKCFRHIVTGNPKTTIVVYVDEKVLSSIDEEPGIRLRRERNKEYKESKKIINDREFIIFSKISQESEKIAFSYSGNKLFVLSIQASPFDKMEKFDNEYYGILTSVKFKSS